MSSKIKLFSLLGLITLLLNGCKAVILNPHGMIAADEKRLIIIATVLMLIVVIPVIIMTFGFAWKYRESNTKAKYTPNWSHSTILEIIWWAIPCVIIAILATITWETTHELDPYKPLSVSGKPITIEVVALDWKWLFIYPEQNIATVNFIQFPVHVPINFKITSDAPMNSFMIPALGGQIYAMAGMQTQLHLIADEEGTYNGMSVSFSGPGFSDMKFLAKASSLEEFNQWVATVKQSPQKLDQETYGVLAKPSEKNKVEYYSSVPNKFYDDLIMKFMMPMPAEQSTDHMQNMGSNSMQMQ